MAFGGPRSSCVRPGAHSARRQDSHNDWTPYRMAEPTRGSSHSARRLRSLAFLCSSNAFLPPMNANQRQSVEIGPLSATLPGPLEPAFLDRPFQIKPSETKR